MSARVVQRHVFDELDTQDLHAFLVWGPMLGEEQRSDAVEATRFLDDERSSHFWTPGHDLAEELAPLAGIDGEGERAWDTFLLFAPGQAWGEAPPKPHLVQHVGKPLPDEQRLHGPTLRQEIEALLGGDDEDGPEPDGDEGPDSEDEAAEAHATGDVEPAAGGVVAGPAPAPGHPAANRRPYR